jgi:hypothetical protein
VEIISALAILDFVNQTDYSESVVKEFGIDREADSLSFNDLSEKSKKTLFRPLTQYFYFNLFLNTELKKTNTLAYGIIEPKIDDAFLSSDFYNALCKFNSLFEEWLTELKNNRRGFNPFELNPSTNEIFTYVNNISPSKDGLFKNKNYDKYIVELNKQKHTLNKQIAETNQNFISLFFNVTSKLITEKFNQ